MGPVKTSVYIYLIPVVTIIASALVLHEPITLILTGMALSEREKAFPFTQPESWRESGSQNSTPDYILPPGKNRLIEGESDLLPIIL